MFMGEGRADYGMVVEESADAYMTEQSSVRDSNGLLQQSNGQTADQRLGSSHARVLSRESRRNR